MRGSNLKDETGKTYNRLTVISINPNRSLLGAARWNCFCSCGKHVTVLGASLRNGSSKSCGCLRTETVTSHGKYKNKLYEVWRNMLERCNNKKILKYKDYGEVGIKVCKEWENSLQDFITWGKKNGYKSGLQIDRRDNTKGYTPDNCRFVTHKVNNQNKRNCKRWYLFGKRYNSCTEAAFDLGVSHTTIQRWCKEDSGKDGCYAVKKYK